LRVVKDIVEGKIEEGMLRQASVDHTLVHGHFLKAYHNLEVMKVLDRFNSQKPQGWVACPD